MLTVTSSSTAAVVHRDQDNWYKKALDSGTTKYFTPNVVDIHMATLLSALESWVRSQTTYSKG